jgi:hypothetical protein
MRAVRLAAAAGVLFLGGCSFLLHFERFEDGGVPASDGAVVTLTIACAGMGDGRACTLDEGVGTGGGRGLPAEIRASAAVFDASTNVMIDPGAAALVADLRAPSSGTSDVIGIVLIAPIDELADSGTVDVPLRVSTSAQTWMDLVVTVRYHPELLVNTPSPGMSDVVYEFSNIVIQADFRATGIEPLELRSYGEVRIEAGAPLSVDGRLPAFPAPGGPGAGGGAGGAGGTGGAAPVDGLMGMGPGGGAGGNGDPTSAHAGGGGGHALAGGTVSGGGAGGASYGTAWLDPFVSPDAAGSGGGGGGGGSAGDGGAGGDGGGALRLIADGPVVFVDDGRISADGSPGAAGASALTGGGGGSGGAVWITAREGVTGPAGTISAAGGVGPGGNGADGFVRLDVPGIEEPTVFPSVGYHGLMWEPLRPELLGDATIQLSLWGEPMDTIEVEVRDATATTAMLGIMVLDATGVAAVTAPLTAGWNLLHACAPDCATAMTTADIAFVYVP